MIAPIATDSTPSKPEILRPPAAAPNVVVVMLDDVGFGAPGTFGGPVPTPALDRVAGQGLLYNRFHTTALCSPSRAALLTGRNHHSAHMGGIGEIAYGGETLDVGVDPCSPVGPYAGESSFTGRIDRVEIELRPRLGYDDRRAFEDGTLRGAAAGQ